MNDTSNRLYISDLDGTLLRSDAMLSGYAKTKIERAAIGGAALHCGQRTQRAFRASASCWLEYEPARHRI